MPNEFADVVFPATVDKAFTYRVPPELNEAARVGCRVLAPFGARRLVGLIVGLKDSFEPGSFEVKGLNDVLDLEPVVSREMLKLAEWMADYYLCPLGDALKAVLPAGLLQAPRKLVRLATDRAESEALHLERRAPRQAQILRFLAKCGRISVSELKRKIGAGNLLCSLNLLQRRGLVTQHELLGSQRPQRKRVTYVHLTDDGEKTVGKPLGPTQQKCLSYLREKGSRLPQAELLRHTGATSSTLKSLQKRNLVRLETKTVWRDYYGGAWQPPKQVTLNQEQQRAFDEIQKAIADERFRTFLVHGVTGSGKTQVYIESIKSVLQRGKSAIVLVPEIALTPQTVQRFRSHFKDRVAVLHSGMSAGERYDSWERLRRGEAVVAIGPRSAVFAPVRNLGLIVVDEEQEDSYKQQDPVPRYHARDVAVYRARLCNAVTVLGSATPSAESYSNALLQKYHLLELTHRVDQVPLPEVTIVDLKKERRMSGKRETPILSRLLVRKLEEKLSRNEQIILLLNRRGFSSHIKCKECGHVEDCTNCEITLTYHLRGRFLRCHYCGLTRKAPEVCPHCAGADILFRGWGTQQVEKALHETFPDARVVRMDLDTTSQKRSHDRILQDFGDGKYDILLGTQMVAKGHDFARVTLVGVINADVGLLIPDFRATERSFQLLTQVAGRAGRQDLPGEVIIQTYSPEEFALQCARTHDFKGFFNGDILARKELLYPPFGRLISILFRGEEEAHVRQAAFHYAGVLKKRNGRFVVLGPSPAPISKIRNKFRWHVLLKSDRRADPAGKVLREAVRQAEAQYRKKHAVQGVQVVVDVDPVALL